MNAARRTRGAKFLDKSFTRWADAQMGTHASAADFIEFLLDKIAQERTQLGAREGDMLRGVGHEEDLARSRRAFEIRQAFVREDAIFDPSSPVLTPLRGPVAAPRTCSKMLRRSPWPHQAR